MSWTVKETDTSHAIIPSYRGGKLIEDNIAELPKPLHAFQHLLVEESLGKGRDKEANRGAVSLIVQRMSPEQLKEFNNLVALHEVNRRKGNW
jgi:hypothetical protein